MRVFALQVPVLKNKKPHLSAVFLSAVLGESFAEDQSSMAPMAVVLKPPST